MTTLLLLLSLTAAPADIVELFHEANEAYYRGDYEQALTRYETIQQSTAIKSPIVYYNMGNAWFRRDAVGKAILYYEAALQLNPDFEPARRNLTEALGHTRRQLPPPDPSLVDTRLTTRYYPLSPIQSLWLVHACFAAVALLLLWRYFRPGPRVRWAVRVVPVIALALYLLTLTVNAARSEAPRLAVTQIPEAPVYFSMSESEQPRFLLYEGDRVLIDRVEGDWLRVTAHGGERGWTRKDNLGVVDYVVM